jgi:hypothetical protein
MELLLLLVAGGIIYFYLKSKKGDNPQADTGRYEDHKDSFSSTDQARISNIMRIINESTDIIDKTKHLHIALERYKLMRDSLIRTQKDPNLKVIDHDSAIDQVIENTKETLGRILTIQFNKDCDEAFDMKTQKGQAQRYIKLVKYYEDNIPKISSELRDEDTIKDSIELCTERLKGMKKETSRETNTIIDAEMELPDWWK